MFTLEPFEPRHLTAFAETAAEINLRRYIEKADLSSLAGNGPAWTGFWNGKPVAAGGFVEVYGPGSIRAVAWAILMRMPKPALRAVHKAARNGLAQAPYRRIEAHVDVRFEASHRWMGMLGFMVETPLKRFWTPEAHSVVEYVMLKDGWE